MKKRADGRWQKVKTINGQKVTFYSRADTERKAIKDIENQMIEYTEKEKIKHSFRYIAELWNEEYRERISDINYRKNTKAAYEYILDYFEEYKNIKDITAVEINIFISKLISKQYYKKTVANYKCILNMIFQYALLNGYILYNPVRDIRLPNNLPKTPRKIPTDAEIKEIDKHYTGFDFLPYFLLYTGLRLSEALALSYEDIDLKNNIITVNKHMLFNNNKPIIENRTKTENSKRAVALLDRVREKLPRKKGLIFGNENGTPYTKIQLQRRWEKYQKTYGVTVTAHQLRHAYATMLFEAGIDLKDAQELMGHSDINLTRQIYTHIRDKRKNETVEKLNSFSF
ncbi:MAG: site-specific integrase [Clostridia bacterium]|nr:site-specific integrase [Clostridia bacterium]